MLMEQSIMTAILRTQRPPFATIAFIACHGIAGFTMSMSRFDADIALNADLVDRSRSKSFQRIKVNGGEVSFLIVDRCRPGNLNQKTIGNHRLQLTVRLRDGFVPVDAF